MKDLYKIYNQLQKELKENNITIDLNKCVSGDRLRIPKKYNNIVGKYIDTIKDLIYSKNIDEDSIKEEDIFLKFLVKYFNSTKEISTNISLLQKDSDTSKKCIKYLFDNYVLVNTRKDPTFNNESTDSLRFIKNLLLNISMYQIESNYTREDFVLEMKEKFNITEINSDYIYKLINSNFDALYKIYVILTLKQLKKR